MGLKAIAAGVALLGFAAAALIAMLGRDAAPRSVANVVSSGSPRVVRVVSKLGHPTHPTWYHDSQLIAIGDRVTVAYNRAGQVNAAQLRSSDLEIIAKAKVSVRRLGGATDSTGTDTDRHDVPAVVADAKHRLAFVYGGGSIAGQGAQGDGPLTRMTFAPNTLAPLTSERALRIGGGAAFDFESVTDGSGTVHLFGQHGSGNTGSLIDLRLGRNGRWRAAREVIRGGFHSRGCVLAGRPRGCNRFAIARVAADPASGRLHMVWGWSEGSLSGKCATDSGYCDHDLNYAYSDDGGTVWHDASGAHTVDIARAPLPAQAPAFRVAAGHVALFKAIAVGPAGPVIVYSTFSGGIQVLMSARLSAGRWTTSPIASAAGSDWSGSLVLRGGASYTLWTPTGNAIHRFTSSDGVSWAHALVYSGPAWSLTGAPAARAGEELLLWRGATDPVHSWVMLGAFPAASQPGPA